ncbi:hypothetical protein BJV74DRAFT_597679 [Russula compacta]|nr:hypothetical protein BJV74DRAFT_597679 [Russula compacta]
MATFGSNSEIPFGGEGYRTYYIPFLTLPALFYKSLRGAPGPLSLPGGKILVRSKYRQAEQAILRANENYCDVFYVKGYPGIGKNSLFSLASLCVAWFSDSPQVVQIDPGYAILLHPAFERIWVLVDWNRVLERPALIFRDCGPFFVFEALSSHAPRTEWTKNVSLAKFCMKMWTLSELQACPLLGIREGGPCKKQELIYLFETYGASPGCWPRIVGVHRTTVTVSCRRESPADEPRRHSNGS